MDYSNSFRIPKEAGKPQLSEDQASDTALYTAGSYPQTNDLYQDYERIYNELLDKGYSESVDLANQAYRDEQERNSKGIVATIIEDPEMPVEQKKAIVEMYKDKGFISDNIKNKFMENLGILDLGDSETDTEAQTELSKSIKTKSIQEDYNKFEFSMQDGYDKSIAALASGKKPEPSADQDKFSLSEMNDRFKKYMAEAGKNYEEGIVNFSKQLFAEGLSVANFISALPYFASDIYETIYEAESSGKEYENYRQARDAAHKKLDKTVVADIMLGQYAESLGVAEQYENSLINKGLTKLDEKITELTITIADFNKETNKLYADKGITAIQYSEDPEQIRVGIDLALLIAPFKYKPEVFKVETPKQIKNTVIDTGRPDSPINNMMISNPKIGAEFVAEAIMDSTGRNAKILGTTPEGALAKYVFPKYGDLNQFTFIPDVRRNLPKDLVNQKNYPLTPGQEKALQYALHDNVITDPVQRLNDKVIRESVHEYSNNLYYNQPSSVILMDSFKYTEKQVYSPSPYYPYTAIDQLKFAYDRLNQRILNNLPIEERGRVQIADLTENKRYTTPDEVLNAYRNKPSGTPKEFILEWTTEKPYDPTLNLGDKLSSKRKEISLLPGFLPDFDITGIGRSVIGEAISGSPALADYFQAGMAGGELRARMLSREGLRPIKQLILNKEAKKLYPEFKQLLKDREANYKEEYSIDEIQTEYAVSRKEAAKLNEMQDAWIRVNNFVYLMDNLTHRSSLQERGFNKGLFSSDGSVYLQAVRSTFEIPAPVEGQPFKAYDFDTKTGIEVQTLEERSNGIFEVETGKQLVLLEKAQQPMWNERNTYGLVGKDFKLDVLPEEVIPKVPGHSRRIQKGHFIVRQVPKELFIDGIKVTNEIRLKNEHSTAVGIARYKKDADALVARFEDKDNYYTFREEARESNLRDVITEYEFHHERVETAKERGEALESIDGETTLADGLQTMMREVQRSSNQFAFKQYYPAMVKQIEREFRKYLPDGKYPKRVEDIQDYKKTNNKEMLQAAKHAYRKLEFYRHNAFYNADKYYQNTFHWIADKLEDSGLSKELAALSRDLGNQGTTLPLGIARKITSIMFILAQTPWRHWVIQPSQYAEISSISPTSAAKSLRLMPAVLMNLMAEHPTLSAAKPILNKMFTKKMTGIDPKDLSRIVEILRMDGVIDAVQANPITGDFFRSSTTKFQEAWFESVANKTIAPIKGALDVLGSSGYVIGELINRIGFWLQLREKWLQDNPGKNWDTPKVRSYLNFESFRRSGAMQKAGGTSLDIFPVANLIFQFQPAQRNIFNNYFEKGATSMNQADRRKWTIMSALWSGVAGIPFGLAILDWMLENTDVDEETFNMMTHGLWDLTGSDTIKESTNKLGNQSGFWITDMIKQSLVFFGMADNPYNSRFPGEAAFGRINRTLSNVTTFLKTKPITEFTAEDYKTLGWMMTQPIAIGKNMLDAKILYERKEIVLGNGKVIPVEDRDLIDVFWMAAGFPPKDKHTIYALERTVKEHQDNKKNFVNKINNLIAQSIKIHGNNPEELDKMLAATSLLWSIAEESELFSTQDVYDMQTSVINFVDQTQEPALSNIVDYYWNKEYGESKGKMLELRNRLKTMGRQDMLEIVDTLDGINPPNKLKGKPITVTAPKKENK